MATSFKTLGSGDVQAVRTKLHEAIPITGSILSGTYKSGDVEINIKNYSHGMFQSVYDYPYLSSSANHIFDITAGYCSGSLLSASTSTQNQQKIQIYNQMAQVLVGHDTTGSIRRFAEDGGIGSGTKIKDAVFINFARLLSKDEIKKGGFYIDFSVNPSGSYPGAYGAVKTQVVRVADVSGAASPPSFKSDSPAGEYNILYASSSTANTLTTNGTACGLLYYQAGVAVLSSSLFRVAASGGLLSNNLVTTSTNGEVWLSGSPGQDIVNLLTGSTISSSADGIRAHMQNTSFNNTTELNSTVYFCRAHNNEFNFSSNPTYLTGSKMRVKTVRTDEPLSFITTVGLYGADNELLAVGKVSEPLKKAPSNEFTLRVRLDY
tara:strand:- start:355 stop:1485 length:1131 start_codon:yes stop_codon:yes gene_type:complete